MKSKAKSGSVRQAEYTARRYNAGLIPVKVWAHPDEAPAVRRHAAELPKTKSIMGGLKK